MLSAYITTKVTLAVANINHATVRPAGLRDRSHTRIVMTFNQSLQANSAWPSFSGWEQLVLAVLTLIAGKNSRVLRRV